MRRMVQRALALVFAAAAFLASPAEGFIGISGEIQGEFLTLRNNMRDAAAYADVPIGICHGFIKADNLFRSVMNVSVVQRDLRDSRGMPVPKPLFWQALVGVAESEAIKILNRISSIAVIETRQILRRSVEVRGTCPVAADVVQYRLSASFFIWSLTLNERDDSKLLKIGEVAFGLTQDEVSLITPPTKFKFSGR